jgi:GMP synthase-like glutamine amidotransferase
MKTVCVVQHTEAEYLGLIEDHLEGRNIRFHYRRPFTAGGSLPLTPEGYDGLILLGGGPYGLVSGHLLPSSLKEIQLTRSFLDAGLPVIGIGLGAIILATAAGGGADEAPLRFEVGRAFRTADANQSLWPADFPVAAYLRDKPALPPGSKVIAASADGEPMVFSIGSNALGFIGHPGMKSGMVEDLIMEFSESPDNSAVALDALRDVQYKLADALSVIMVAIGACTSLP